MLILRRTIPGFPFTLTRLQCVFNFQVNHASSYETGVVLESSYEGLKLLVNQDPVLQLFTWDRSYCHMSDFPADNASSYETGIVLESSCERLELLVN
jgi:hypothetical protein